MELYHGVEEEILEKAISEEYGYTEGQVFDIYAAALKRVRGNKYSNIPLQEKSWMVDRWTWKILFPLDLDAFPGKKPGWIGDANYFSPKRGQSEIEATVEGPKKIRAEIKRKSKPLNINSQLTDRPLPQTEPEISKINTGTNASTGSARQTPESRAVTKLLQPMTKSNSLIKTYAASTSQISSVKSGQTDAASKTEVKVSMPPSSTCKTKAKVLIPPSSARKTEAKATIPLSPAKASLQG